MRRDGTLIRATFLVAATLAIGACVGSDGTTDPGSQLSVGESAVVEDDLGRVKTKIEITPIKIRRGTAKDLAGFEYQESVLGQPIPRGPAEEASVTPVYATVRFKNVGDGVLDHYFPDIGIDVVTGPDDALDTAKAEDSVGADFRPCPLRPGPEPFRKGASFETCLTFLVEPNTKLQGIAWKAYDLPDGGILWAP